MSREEFITRKIKILKESLNSFQRVSLVLFIVAVISIGLSFIKLINNPFVIEFLKYGLTSVTALSGTALQGYRYIRKNKLIELEYCEGKVDQYETLEEFDKRIINSALEGLLNK